MSKQETRALEVTQEDITAGVRASATRCPFALAARRLFPGWHSVTVVNNIVCSSPFRYAAWDIEPRGVREIVHYDDGGAMEPGTYTLTLRERRSEEQEDRA